MQKIIEEYENDAQFRNEIPEWRRKLAEVWRVNLENPRRAEEVLHPLFARTDLSIDIDQEIGKTLLASRQYVEAEAALQRAWTKASRTKNCPSLKTLQMDLIQTYAVSKRCEKAIEWSEQKLPESCEPDRLSLALERANCLEINGDAVGAMKIYDELIKLNPKNMRAQYLLENIKRRERKKEIK
jgi:tetratricopeptide (TPR) repeat protein